MPDCDYCDASFEGEDAYYDHLAEEHDDELGRIDRRRVDEHRGTGEKTEFPTGPVILLGVIGFAALLVVYLIAFAGGGGKNTGAGDSAWLPDQGDQTVISQVTTEPSTGRGHVSAGTELNYERIPPTSGPHYGSSTVKAGFYEQEQPLGALVHSLEHGAIIVYYDPSQLTPEAESSLKKYSQSLTGPFQSFIAVPNPTDDPDAAYVLTAWEKRLTMDQYDNSTVRAFTAEYLGRGPEKTVR